jgi:enoyl-CoA hydratase/carnithine racemase
MPNSTTPESLHIELTPGVLSFTLQTPEPGNEISGLMMDAMIEALATQGADPQMRVLRLRARGLAFCTGRERAGRTPVTIRAEVGRLIALKKALRASPLITVAEVQGDAHGFGMGLAMLCDFTLVSRSARLAFPEMRKGLPPAAIMAYMNSYGLPKACFPLVLFGDDFSPAQALAAGLITQVCEPADLSAEADRIADRVLGLDPDSARQCKAFFQAAQEATVEQNFRLAHEALTVTSLRLMGDKR